LTQHTSPLTQYELPKSSHSRLISLQMRRLSTSQMPIRLRITSSACAALLPQNFSQWHNNSSTLPLIHASSLMPATSNSSRPPSLCQIDGANFGEHLVNSSLSMVRSNLLTCQALLRFCFTRQITTSKQPTADSLQLSNLRLFVKHWSTTSILVTSQSTWPTSANSMPRTRLFTPA